MRKQSNRSLRTKICSTTQQNFINGILSQKTIKWDPITEMHRGRERGQNIRDLIAEIVEAQNLVSFYFNNDLNKNTYLRNYVECTYSDFCVNF